MALTLGDNFSYQGAKPLDARLKYDTLASMKAVADATMYDGCMAYCSATDKTYQWKSTNTVDESTGKWREFSSGGGGGSSYTAGDGIDIDENNVISTEQSESGDMDEIVDNLPQGGTLVRIADAFNKGDLYSTDEKMIGQWEDSKPLYQKTIVIDTLSLTGAMTDISLSSLGVDAEVDYVVVINAYLYRQDGAGYWISCPFYAGTSDYVGVNAFKIPSTNVSHIRVSVPSGAQSTFKKLRATIQYTKQSDTAISIGEETEYSTTEKVVGTWVDGKPIYAKTIADIVPTTDNSWYYPLDDSSGWNMDKLIKLEGFMDTTGSNPIKVPIPYNDASNHVWCQFNLDRLFLNQTLGSTWKLSITVFYTKKTT